MDDQGDFGTSADLKAKLSLYDEHLENLNKELENYDTKVRIEKLDSKTHHNSCLIDLDVKRRASNSKPLNINKFKEKKICYPVLDKSQSMEAAVFIFENLEIFQEERLEEAKGLIKFEDEQNDKLVPKNYEENENINKNIKKNIETKLNTHGLQLFTSPENITAIEKTSSSGTTDEYFFPCPFCYHALPSVGKGFTVELGRCRHTLCRWCITKILENILKNITVEPRCPYIQDFVQCNSLIEEHEIRELVEPNLYESYLEKLVTRIKEDADNKIFYCNTPGCKAWYILEDNNVKTFLCTLCKIENNVDTEANKKEEEPIADGEKYLRIERYNEILHLMESNVVPNFESFECPVCLVQYEPQEGLILKNCLHTFCKECIANVVLYSEDADIKCPYKNDDYSCNEIILQSEIKAVVKPDDFQKYLQKSIAQVERKAGKSAFHCKTPNCPGWCFVESGVDHFLCPTCKEDNCFLCEKIHTGRGCIDNTISENISKVSDDLIKIMLENGNALLCPTCEAVIMKVDGCDAVTCTSCKTLICWVTRGPRWGPNGIGDKSGGCKCEAYAKCHPDCRNCH